LAAVRSDDRIKRDVVLVEQTVRRFTVGPGFRLIWRAPVGAGGKLCGELHQAFVSASIAENTFFKLLKSPRLWVQDRRWHGSLRAWGRALPTPRGPRCDG